MLRNGFNRFYKYFRNMPLHRNRFIKFCILLSLTTKVIACKDPEIRLPILGEPSINGTDTIYPIIANFKFVDQDSTTVTNETFANKIYVADFIFLSCPTICPRMTAEMHKVYLPFQSDDRVAFISHTIDPKHDSIPRLKAYANALGVTSRKWHFVTGSQDSIITLSETSYYSAAFPDSTAPGGFTHSGGLLLVDKNRHIRGVYNSTKDDETDRLIKDIQILLREQF